MIFSLFGRKKANLAVVRRQYETITRTARNPLFYREMNAPDTVMGRFEILVLHMVLFFRHSRNAGDIAQMVAQEIVEAFFEDIDHSMRELGIGDAGVPKRMKKLTRMFYGRVKSYEDAIAAGDAAALAAALGRNIHPAAEADAPPMDALAAYALVADAGLAAVPARHFEDGTVAFPDPAAAAGARAQAGQ